MTIRRPSGHLNPGLLGPSASVTVTEYGACCEAVPTAVQYRLGCATVSSVLEMRKPFLGDEVTGLQCVGAGAELSPWNGRALATLKGHREGGTLPWLVWLNG